ncbi:MAG: hypothetical protein M5U19_22360 [Microthrixaceae bacterium]|nr:hypothetical protein [Microthrixaceae bacterium]
MGAPYRPAESCIGRSRLPVGGRSYRRVNPALPGSPCTARSGESFEALWADLLCAVHTQAVGAVVQAGECGLDLGERLRCHPVEVLAELLELGDRQVLRLAGAIGDARGAVLHLAVTGLDRSQDVVTLLDQLRPDGVVAFRLGRICVRRIGDVHCHLLFPCSFGCPARIPMRLHRAVPGCTGLHWFAGDGDGDGEVRGDLVGAIVVSRLFVVGRWIVSARSAG